jgi:hypothetical protein
MPEKKKKKKKQHLADAIDTDAKAILFAHSLPASLADSSKDRIFQCIVNAFDNQGLKHISSMADQIVWGLIPQAVVQNLGQAIRGCVRTAIKDPGDLIGPFSILRTNNRVMSVGDLVDGINELV